MKMNQDMDKIKVLLVEDEQTLAMIIKDTLECRFFFQEFNTFFCIQNRFSGRHISGSCCPCHVNVFAA